MEPVITTIAAAVALGAAAGLKDTASKAVVDAYAGLKKLIQDRYQHDKGVTFAAEHVSEKTEEETLRQKMEEFLDILAPVILEGVMTLAKVHVRLYRLEVL
ncbi:MAG: hypothetical protein Q3M30_05175 [Candidatus Electrothrix sp. Rat3]|nr:hypothetical protein [Candidatus Electrothrix rattekaaiensis]